MTDNRRDKVDLVLSQRQADLTVLAEKLHKPRNFSAIIRTCDAVGINEVHAVPGEEGMKIHWNTSQGAEKWMQVRAHESLESACAHLRRENFQLVAAHLSGQAEDYRELDYTRPTAFVLGSEAHGVSADWVQPAYQGVKLPMLGSVDSLNVSATAAVLLYEAQRQRRKLAGDSNGVDVDPPGGV